MTLVLSPEEQCEDLKRRLNLLEGEKRSAYDMANRTIKQNKEVIDRLKEENRSSLRQMAIENGYLQSFQGESKLEKQRNLLNKKKAKFDKLSYSIERTKDKIYGLREYCERLGAASKKPLTSSVKDLTLESLQNGDGDEFTEEEKKIVVSIKNLEENIEDIGKRYQEGLSISRTYNQIKEKLSESATLYDDTIKELEKKLKGKDRDYEDLLLLSHDAYHAKEMSLAELHRFETSLEEERAEREKEVMEKRLIVQQRVDMNLQLEQREKCIGDGNDGSHLLSPREKREGSSLTKLSDNNGNYKHNGNYHSIDGSGNSLEGNQKTNEGQMETDHEVLEMAKDLSKLFQCVSLINADLEGNQKCNESKTSFSEEDNQIPKCDIHITEGIDSSDILKFSPEKLTKAAALTIRKFETQESLCIGIREKIDNGMNRLESVRSLIENKQIDVARAKLKESGDTHNRLNLELLRKNLREAGEKFNRLHKDQEVSEQTIFQFDLAIRDLERKFDSIDDIRLGENSDHSDQPVSWNQNSHSLRKSSSSLLSGRSHQSLREDDKLEKARSLLHRVKSLETHALRLSKNARNILSGVSKKEIKKCMGALDTMILDKLKTTEKKLEDVDGIHSEAFARAARIIRVDLPGNANPRIVQEDGREDDAEGPMETPEDDIEGQMIGMLGKTEELWSRHHVKYHSQLIIDKQEKNKSD